MATPIPCDWDGCDGLADVLVSDITNGDGNGWCGPHYVEVCRQVVHAVDDAAATAEAQEADAQALARLAALGGPTDPTASGPSSDAIEAPDDEPGTPGGDESGQGADDAPVAARGRQRASGVATGAVDGP